MRGTLIFSLVLSVLAVVFALQNPDPMEVNLLFFQTMGSKALVLIVTFAIGVIVGLLSMLPGRIRDKRTIKKLRRSSSAGPSAGSSTSIPGTASTPSSSSDAASSLSSGSDASA